MGPHRQVCKPAQRPPGRVRMDGRERPGMSGIQGVQEGTCLHSSNLAENDPVWTPAKRGLEERLKRNLRLVGVTLGLNGNDVRLDDIELRSVLDHNEPFPVGNGAGEHPEQGGLSTTRAPTDENGLANLDLSG